jgi:hypothetical protein
MNKQRMTRKSATRPGDASSGVGELSYQRISVITYDTDKKYELNITNASKLVGKLSER